MIRLTQYTAEPVRPDITPLLDVVFILLIFFVVSSVFTVQGLSMDLPESAAAKPFSGRTHTIRITDNNTLVFDRKPISARKLSFALASLKGGATGRAMDRIVLECSPKARVGVFIRTADQVKSAGFQDLIIAASRPGTPDRN
jgi:biopolymer transport protein ExbD